MEVWAGLVPSEAGRDNLPQASHPASGAFSVLLGVPWLVEASL